MLKSKVIPVNDLKVGYILDEDIIDDNVLLLRKGLIITDRIKELLSHRKEVRVIEDVVDTHGYTQENLCDERLVVLDEGVKVQLNKGVTTLFENLDSPESSNIAKDLSSVLVNEVLTKDGVGINIEALKISDEYTFKHSVDVAAMGITLAKNLGLANDKLIDIGTAGILHDIGKIKIPNEILNKNSSLTDNEFRIIKNHPVYGYQLLMENTSLSESIRRGVLHHHEKYGGGGYPSNLKGNDIPLYARILCVVDVFDALVTERPYHVAYSVGDALEIMYTMASQFDMKIFRAFLNSLVLYPIGSLVLLSTGEQCQVVRANDGYPLRPVVKCIDTGEEFDLANDPFCLSRMIL